MRKKVEKMLNALHKVDMRDCYAKQKINLACPKASDLLKMLREIRSSRAAAFCKNDIL